MPVRAVIDTNVWVSAFINPHGTPAKILESFLRGDFEVVVSIPLLEELAEVLSRPRIHDKYHLEETDTASFIELLALRGHEVFPSGELHGCRDPDDDLLLEAAILGEARYMVSRDDDIKSDQELIAQLEAKEVKVVSVQRFLDELVKAEGEV